MARGGFRVYNCASILQTCLCRYAALAVATLAGSKEGVDTILRCRIIAWEKALLGLMTDQDGVEARLCVLLVAVLIPSRASTAV